MNDARKVKGSKSDAQEVKTKTTGTGRITVLTGETGAKAVNHTHECPECGDTTRTVSIHDNAISVGKRTISLRWSCGHYRGIQ